MARQLWPEVDVLDITDFDLLTDEVRGLIDMLKTEIGLNWMSCALRFQIEAIEVLIGDRGTVPIPPPDE